MIERPTSLLINLCMPLLVAALLNGCVSNPTPSYIPHDLYVGQRCLDRIVLENPDWQWYTNDSDQISSKDVLQDRLNRFRRYTEGLSYDEVFSVAKIGLSKNITISSDPVMTEWINSFLIQWIATKYDTKNIVSPSFFLTRYLATNCSNTVFGEPLELYLEKSTGDSIEILYEAYMVSSDSNIKSKLAARLLCALPQFAKISAPSTELRLDALIIFFRENRSRLRLNRNYGTDAATVPDDTSALFITTNNKQ